MLTTNPQLPSFHFSAATQFTPQHNRPLQLPESEMRGPILGLNLLYLLVENRLAEFHSEVQTDTIIFRPVCLLV